jgi:hypothetical protein
MMPTSRNELLSLLSEACEIEHSLACAYLYAAFSLKKETEDRPRWRDQQITQYWAGQIYFVASQEMLHLAQAWNLLAAIGGTPYFMHPVFPQPKSYWPLPAALTLQSFCLETVERFLQWEAPVESTLRPGFIHWEHSPTEQDLAFRSVGELYELIAHGIEAMPEADLFIGNPDLQIGPDLADFPDLVAVYDKRSALEAIRRVQFQGEGIHDDREDSHFGIFHEMRIELNRMLGANPHFQPAYPTLQNPTTRERAGANLITHPAARQAMTLFNNIYVLTIRILGWVFGPGSPGQPQTRGFARASIGAMPVILKPLGEALARMPSGDGTHTAGASFAMQRHVPLPHDADDALRLVSERIDELIVAARELQQREDIDQDFSWLAGRLEWMLGVVHGEYSSTQKGGHDSKGDQGK